MTPRMLADHASLSARVNVHYQGEVIASNLQVESGQFESALKRNVRDKVTMRFAPERRPVDPWSPLNKNGQKSHLFVDMTLPDGEVLPIDMGFFQHDEWFMERGQVVVVAYGLLDRVRGDPWPFPTSPLSGSTVEDELSRICAPHLTVAPNHVTAQKLSPGLAWGNDKSKAIEDLENMLGVFVRTEADQQLHVYDMREYRSPVASYSEDDLLLEVSAGESRGPNVWTGKGGDEKDTSKRWSHTITSDGWMRPETYGTVRELVTVSSAKSVAEVRLATEVAYQKTTAATESLEVSMLSDPRLECGDPIGLIRVDEITGLTSARSVRVVGHAFDLVSNSSSPARLDVEVLRW